MEIARKINRILGVPLVWVILFYQKTLSPDHGLLRIYYPHGFCRFYPSCSEYARLNLTNTGITAIPKIVYRVIRCNPFNRGGVDLPQSKHTKL